MSWKNYSVTDSKSYSYDYFFLDYVCRLCWGTDGKIELSSVSPRTDTTIAEKIQECLGIDVTHNHPKKICSECLNEIELFSEFKKVCMETDKKLKDILQKSTPVLDLCSPLIEPLTLKKEFEEEDEVLFKQESEVAEDDCPNSEMENFFVKVPVTCKLSESIKDRLARKGVRKKKSAYYCFTCQTDYKSFEKLASHNVEFHGMEENGLYKCFGCERRFENLRKRLRHENDCKGVKCGYKCDKCDRFFPKRRIFERHIQLHRENKELVIPDDLLQCNKCMKTFESVEILRKHTHKVEDKKTTHVCDICGKVFARVDYFYQHKKVHEGNKLQKCPHCDYRTIQKSALTVHIRMHTGERPYPCDMCEHRCVTSSNLREHRKRHLGIKEFACKLCDKRFGYKLSLTEHMASAHERSESHTCTHCGSTYARFRGLRRHLLVKHGKKVKKFRSDFVIKLQNEEPEGNKYVTFDSNTGNESVKVAEIQNTDGVDSNV